MYSKRTNKRYYKNYSSNQSTASSSALSQQLGGQMLNMSTFIQPATKQKMLKPHVTEVPEMFSTPKKKSYYSLGLPVTPVHNAETFAALPVYGGILNQAVILFARAFNTSTGNQQLKGAGRIMDGLKLNEEKARDFNNEMVSETNQFYSKFNVTGAVPLPQLNPAFNGGGQATVDLTIQHFTLADIMYAAGGYMNSVAWYVRNGYQKVSDYQQLIMYANSRVPFKAGWSGTFIDMQSKMDQLPRVQFNNEIPTLLFVDYNEKMMEEKGYKRQDDSFVDDKGKFATDVDQFIFLLPELYVMNKTKLKKSIDAMLELNQEYQAKRTDQYIALNGQDVQSQVDNYLNKAIDALENGFLEFFKPSVNIPFVQCVNTITTFSYAAVGTQFYPQFKLTTQPTYSKENALATNPFSGFYKRSVARYYPKTGAFVSSSTASTVLMRNIAKGGSYDFQIPANSSTIVATMDKFNRMVGKDTYDRPLIIKAFQKHMTRDSDMDSLRKIVNFKLMFAGTAWKGSQFLNTYFDFVLSSNRLKQGGGQSATIVPVYDFSGVGRLFKWRQMISNTNEQPLYRPSEFLGMANTIFHAERVRKFMKRYPSFATDRTLIPIAETMQMNRQPDGTFTPSYLDFRTEYQAQVFLFVRFIKSYRKIAKTRGKNPYTFDAFLHTLMGTGVAPPDDYDGTKSTPDTLWLQHIVRTQDAQLGEYINQEGIQPEFEFNNLTVAQRIEAVSSMKQIPAKELTLHKMYRQPSSAKLSGDPAFILWALLSNSHSNQQLKAKHLRSINTAQTYNNRQATYSAEAVFERYQQYAGVREKSKTEQNIESLTCMEILPTENHPLLIAFVWGLYAHCLLMYCTGSYKGVSDFDVYYFLVHASSWLNSANEMFPSSFSGKIWSTAVIRSLPVYRMKQVDQVSKQKYMEIRKDAVVSPGLGQPAASSRFMDAIFDPPVRAARANAIAAGMEVEQL